MTDEKTHIVFDIGGTKTRIARVADGALADIGSFRTEEEPEAGLEALIKAVRGLVNSSLSIALAGDTSGIIEDGIVVHSPHLPHWDGFPLQKRLTEAIGAPVKVFNDAELVALGEYVHGAGEGTGGMLYVTVSTGVGGAYIEHGAICRGRYNAEFGHQIVDGGKELEALISGTAVHERYGIHPKDLSDERILGALADTLAMGLYNSTLHFSPSLIVLGGSMIVGQNAIPLARVEEALTNLLKKYYPTAPRIKKAALGDLGGLWGGMAYLEKNR